MASVNFLKLHTAGDVKAQLRHSITGERERREHANTDIDKNRTALNADTHTYAEACAAYDRRIAELDGTNRRKDRVTALGLEPTTPEGLPPA